MRGLRAVHPRVCGEHVGRRLRGWHVGGSSPRVRGTRSGRRWPDGARRFIPACAGNTFVKGDVVMVTQVHPRVCGEHVRQRRRCYGDAGSSPRVRGTRIVFKSNPRAGRFIPACAGNTGCRERGRGTGPVHPRVCGEHFLIKMSRISHYGSSPRVRGTRRERGRSGGIQWFIPACAGNTWRRAGRRCRRAVHPRVCGEHLRIYMQCDQINGSSPRVRGTRL